ncbi:MAG: hypothetical protein JSS56_24795 [Proteobacteria bacterium]|nr:hypothetical protein [Pseudomonadota bacterium]
MQRNLVLLSRGDAKVAFACIVGLHSRSSMTGQTATKSPYSQALTLFLSVSSASIIVLALLGYGVATSAEAKFGVPHAIMFNSTSDLLTLGGWAIIETLSHLNKLFEWSFYRDVWTVLWPMSKPALVILLAGTALMGLIQLARDRNGKSNWLERRRASIRSWVRKHPWIATCLALPVFVTFGTFSVWILIALAFVFGVALIAALLSVVPTLGHLAGQNHIDDWVIGPKICIPIRSRETRLSDAGVEKSKAPGEKQRAANCVAITLADGKEFKGRVVFATFSAIVLFDPSAGTVQRVATGGASVEVVGKL